jgi:3-hydroxyacyl-[acyl-carrier-protein] dehydratase
MIDIIVKLPYSEPFLFVDEITKIDENGVEGNFYLRKDLYFFKGHFKDNPIVPGVILTEIMAQIGLVCFGYFLTKSDAKQSNFALTSTDIEFLKPVYPNEKVFVVSEKIYFRFGKLKCKVKMYNELQNEVCSGLIAGMIVNKNH